MFQMLPESSGRLVALRVSGKLTKEDMVSVAPPLEEKIRENGKVDLFCDMTGLVPPRFGEAHKRGHGFGSSSA